MSGNVVAPRFGRARKLELVGVVLALVVVAAACEAKPGDFTGDSKADEVYIVNSTGAWVTAGSSTPLFTGQAGDIPVAGDYNGDLKWEPAVLRGTTWISSALTDPIVYDPAGMPAGPVPIPAPSVSAVPPPPTLLPVPGDYDGTGKTVPAYYDEVDATWWIMGRDGDTQFGIPPTLNGGLGYDVPVPADYDGDGKTDIAVFRPTDDTFHYLSSKTGGEVVLPVTVPAGQFETMPVPGDYDGVGHAEAALTDQTMLDWYVGTTGTSIASFTPETDPWFPAPADYNGDGKVEPAAFDGETNSFWLAGQPKPTEKTGEATITDTAAVSPTASIGDGYNYIRLVLLEQCELAVGTQFACTGSVHG